MQSYRVDVGLVQVILGNDALLKCDIPSFVTDFVSVSAWIDSEGTTFPGNTYNGKHPTVKVMVGRVVRFRRKPK